MTTTVKIDAHCDDKTEVKVVIADKDTTDETFILQDGESLSRYVYDDIEITVKEIEKINIHNLDTILNLKIDNDDFPNATIKEYLRELLMKVWDEGESFNGKRPFGNSGWEYDLYKPLVVACIVPGSLDDEGYIEDVDIDEADKIIFNLIEHLFE